MGARAAPGRYFKLVAAKEARAFARAASPKRSSYGTPIIRSTARLVAFGCGRGVEGRRRPNKQQGAPRRSRAGGLGGLHLSARYAVRESRRRCRPDVGAGVTPLAALRSRRPSRPGVDSAPPRRPFSRGRRGWAVEAEEVSILV